MSPFNEFERIVADNAAEVFLSYVADATLGGECDTPGPTSAESVVASIGFAAERARGNLTLVSRFDHASAVSHSPTKNEVCDVFGELANMLLGRLKNRLLLRGVTLLIGLPNAETAQDVRVQPTDGSSSWQRIDFGSGHCYVRLAVCFDNDFVLAPEGVLEDAGPVGAEGDMMFF